MTNNFYTELKDHVIQITGEKADKFIHGQFTNSITTLHEGWGNYNLFLTLKGKIRADLFVYNWNQNIYLLVNPNFTSEIVEHLKKLAPLSKCEIVDLFASNHLIHVMGKTIDEISHLKLNQVVQINLNQIKILAFRTDRWGQYGVDLMIHPKDVQIIKDF